MAAARRRSSGIGIFRYDSTTIASARGLWVQRNAQLRGSTADTGSICAADHRRMSTDRRKIVMEAQFFVAMANVAMHKEPAFQASSPRT